MLTSRLTYRIEHLAKFKKKQADVLKRTKQGTIDTAQQVVDVTFARKHDNDTSWKREILEGRKHRQSSDQKEGTQEPNLADQGDNGTSVIHDVPATTGGTQYKGVV